MALLRQFFTYLTRSGARSRRYLLSFHAWRTRLFLWLGAIAVGAMAALFARLAEASMHGLQWMVHYSAWLVLVISPAGLVLAVWLTRRFFNGAEGSGIPQTIAVVGTACGNSGRVCCPCGWPPARLCSPPWGWSRAHQSVGKAPASR